MDDRRVVKIECTVRNLGHQAPLRDDEWQVLEARALEFTLPADLSSGVAVFTSQNAVFAFAQQYQRERAYLSEVPIEIAAVGAVTLNTVRNLVSPLLKKVVIHPCEDEVGLEPLLSALERSTPCQKFFIFTARDGRSEATVSKLGLSGKSEIHDVYELRTLSAEPTPPLVAALQSNETSIELECRAGRVAKEVVTSLCRTLKCDSPSKLPKQIVFRCFGQSTFEYLKSVGLEQRTKAANVKAEVT